MSELIIYLLKANLALTLFYIGYRVGLRNLTFYKLNRYYLLLAFTFSSVYPLINWTQLFGAKTEIPSELLTVVPNWREFQLTNDEMGWNQTVEILFWISVVLFFIRLLIKLGGVLRIHLKSIPARWTVYSYRRSKEDIAPFSFWKNIYLNPNKHNDDELEQIFRHEYVHVCQLHSLDILIAEIALTLFWFNPISWSLRKCVRENIEFITDHKVISLGVDKRSYQYSLLNISTQSSQVILGNQFNFYNLKKRIMMMNKKQSSNTHLSKYVVILSAILVASFIFGVTKATENEGTTLQKSTSKSRSLHLQDTLKKSINLENGSDTLINTLEIRQEKSSLDSALIYINGIKAEKKTLDDFETDNIQSINVLKGQKAIELYGNDAKGGVIEITTKQGK